MGYSHILTLLVYKSGHKNTSIPKQKAPRQRGFETRQRRSELEHEHLVASVSIRVFLGAVLHEDQHLIALVGHHLDIVLAVEQFVGLDAVDEGAIFLVEDVELADIAVEDEEVVVCDGDIKDAGQIARLPAGGMLAPDDVRLRAVQAVGGDSTDAHPMTMSSTDFSACLR